MRAFLYWFTGRLPCRIICDGDSPYLERYYLWTVFGTHWYLHRFVASDPDRGYHDQPVALGILHPARRLVLGGDARRIAPRALVQRAAHFARRYSSSGVTRLIRSLDRGCTTCCGVRAVRWQAHDHSRGLFTVTLP
jgi:hypothetical protein